MPDETQPEQTTAYDQPEAVEPAQPEPTEPVAPTPEPTPAPEPEPVAPAVEPAPENPPTMPTPTTQDEQFGEVHLVTSTGANAASYPTLDGLEADAYTHIEAFLHLGDGNPVKPEDIGLGTLAPYFNEAAKGLFIAKEVVTDLRAALSSLHPAPKPAS